MEKYAFPPPPMVSLMAMSSHPFPVRRVICVVGNYPAANNPNPIGLGRPQFFLKPAEAILDNNGVLPVPSETTELLAEVHLVVALHKGGARIPTEKVDYDYVFGYAVGLDITRGDALAIASGQGAPWGAAKCFVGSAPCTAITPEFYSGAVSRGKIELKVNGEVWQSADVADLLVGIPTLVHQLSSLMPLQPGDLIFTGSPAGAAHVASGDNLEANVAGLEPLTVTVG